MNTAILIPARYGSSRYHAKPLIELAGVPMIQHVYQRAAATGMDTYVLTDDKRIADLFDPENVLLDTENYYDNGTERCAGAIRDPRFDKYSEFINVQGDMPDIDPLIIFSVLEAMDDESVVTAYTLMDTELQQDPNAVKMTKQAGYAQWFGRETPTNAYGHHHLGIYGYSRKALSEFSSLRVPHEETSMGLEQMRWLYSGYDIKVVQVEFDGIEINSPEDSIKWNKVNV